ncbi:MAG TPA: VIT domain-containing protein [Aggregatilineales bacterium]|nr:VWA domain-containing protein [Anaerolineales bacterium]HRE47785.1 VIT domain-containing protein [Aggregatilineales bacterium]
MSTRLIRITAFLCALTLLAGTVTVGATGIQGRDKGNPRQAPERVSVYLKSHRVSIKIENQLATTSIEQVFYNPSDRMAEGEYLFPLPEGAAVADLTLFIDGQPIKGEILDAKQAQAIYTEIVRRLQDPVLLQYVGRNAVKANIFPIPPRSERKISLTYTHIAPAESGLIHYTYPLRTDYISKNAAAEVSVAMEVTSNTPIGTIYSPNAQVAINRTGETSFRAGFETSNYRATEDFTVYYGAANDEIAANLLTYRESADLDGFFLLMLTPPTKNNITRVIPKDVIIVLDQSGSMVGPKWDQARQAAEYILNNLNEGDRLNVVIFSSGYRIFANAPQPSGEAGNAIRWVKSQDALGGTDINTALTVALDAADKSRQTVILFFTDGLPTEGITDRKAILENVRARANANTRIFAFGVGDDVDTFLLDSLSTTYGGTSVYVRPTENIKEKAQALYDKIVSPVLTNIKLTIAGAILEDTIPAAPLPDLFAGSQLVIAGRYRGQGGTTITLTGDLNGETKTYTYEGLNFSANAGGQPFVARLWAQRKIGALLNQIRLNGETRELVDSVVALSVRYGIITPYTSFLITEDDIRRRTEGGVPPPAPGDRDFSLATPLALPIQGFATIPPPSGAGAVERSKSEDELRGGNSIMAMPTATAAAFGYSGQEEPKDQDKGSASAGEIIKPVAGKTFVLRVGIWVDSEFLVMKDVTPVKVKAFSDEYFALLTKDPHMGEYLAIGEHVVIVIGGTVYEIVPN